LGKFYFPFKLILSLTAMYPYVIYCSLFFTWRQYPSTYGHNNIVLKQFMTFRPDKLNVFFLCWDWHQYFSLNEVEVR